MELPTRIDELISQPVVVINIGLVQFTQSLADQGVEVVQVDGVPPAGGDEVLMDLLEKLL